MVVFFITEVGVDVLVNVSRLLCVVLIVIDVGVASEREIRVERYGELRRLQTWCQLRRQVNPVVSPDFHEAQP